MTSLDEIKEWIGRCERLITETEKTDTLLNRARRYELRNLRFVLKGILDHPALLSPDRLIYIFKNVRQRIQKLIDHPESAGNHDHMLQKAEERSKKVSD